MCGFVPTGTRREERSAVPGSVVFTSSRSVSVCKSTALLLLHTVIQIFCNKMYNIYI